MLHAFYALKGKYVDKQKLADDAIFLERILCRESGGIQDQISASFGGFNRINFSAEGYAVNSIEASSERRKELNDNLMLFFTGLSRFSSDIQKSTESSIKKNSKKRQLIEILSLVNDAENILKSASDLNEFGKLLDYTWKLKRSITDSISNNSIDDIYSIALKAGAVGGKLLGAGGGGFMIFYIEKDRQAYLKQALSKLLYVPFVFENTGTRVLYFSHEDESNDNHKTDINTNTVL
jgi:D-glycero-alpha-D-manno-heptose-7-phosphate kinase